MIISLVHSARRSLFAGRDHHAGIHGAYTLRRSAEIDVDGAPVDLHAIGLQVDADWRPPRLAGLVVEAAVVLGAFDDLVHHEPVGEMHLLVRAEPVGGKIL